MKKQNKLNIKIRDLEPLKDVWAGRRRQRHARAGAFRDLDNLRREHRSALDLFRGRLPQ